MLVDGSIQETYVAQQNLEANPTGGVVEHPDIDHYFSAFVNDREDPKAVKILHGYNKDHRPDCKQIVFGLNITGDGHVPLSFHEERTTEQVQVGRGRPGPNTRYEEKEKIHYQLEWTRDESEM